MNLTCDLILISTAAVSEFQEMVMINLLEMLNAEKPLLRIYSVEGLEYLKLFYFFVVAIAEVYKNEGNDEYNKKNFNSAIYFYTEGIKVNCKDEELNAKLYSNRAAAHFNLGKKLFILAFTTWLSCSHPAITSQFAVHSLPYGPNFQTQKLICSYRSKQLILRKLSYVCKGRGLGIIFRSS